jgi:hypothetical protein
VLGDGARRQVVVEVGQPHVGQGTAPADRDGAGCRRRAMMRP